MFGGQATWYYESLAGISMTPGTKFYKDITIEPALIYGIFLNIKLLLSKERKFIYFF